jgi:hypothetical protein
MTGSGCSVNWTNLAHYIKVSPKNSYGSYQYGNEKLLVWHSIFCCASNDLIRNFIEKHRKCVVLQGTVISNVG